MAKKTISFDAVKIITSPKAANYLNVEAETDYLNEVLDNFDADEIIQNYSDLDKLYGALKKHFNVFER